jgi:hypothetical protein
LTRSAPQNTHSKFKRGRNTKGAFEAFKKAVIADPRNLNGLKNLGLLYAMTGARQGVENTHERMLAIDGMAARVFWLC